MPDFAPCLPRLRRYARALTGDRHRADDLVQDTLERGWAKLSLFSAQAPGSRLEAWLLAIMHNVFVNQYRRPAPAAESLDDQAAEPALRPTQSDGLEVGDLERALARLPAEQREILVLVALADCSYGEAAHIAGVPVGTVMSRLSRARERLRQLLAQESWPPLRIVK